MARRLKKIDIDHPPWRFPWINFAENLTG